MTESNRGWQQFFDAHAPDYMENVFTKDTVAEVDFLCEVLQLASGATICDLGCGTGRHAIELAKRGYQVVGVDQSPGMLNAAREAAAESDVEIDFICASAQEFNSPVELQCDALLCACEGGFGLLEADDDSLEQPLAILRRVQATLKPGATCVFTVLNAFKMARESSPTDTETGTFDPLTMSVPTDCLPLGNEKETPSLRERGFVPTELKLLFQSAGLAIDHIYGGTAGNWRRGPLELDEYEIMVIAHAPS